MSNQSDEFFIGWEGKAPEGIGKSLRKKVLLVPMFVAIGAIIASQQSAFTNAKVEKAQAYNGILISEPVPMLVTEKPDPVSGASIFFLVNPMKEGFDLELAKANHLKGVRLTGKLLHSESGQSMIEVKRDSLKSEGQGQSGNNPLGITESLGEMTLQGEIVDSKCYLGQMNPGHMKTHRACAIHCISGGIPPVLLVRTKSGDANYFLLTDEHGKPVNDRVLDIVALPVEITGTVKKMGELLVLKAAPTSYKRLDQ